jgi:homoserine dehydrogenase
MHPHPVPPAPLRVGLLGVGTVGAGTCRVLQRNRELIRARAGRSIELAMVAARDVHKARARVGPQAEVVGDALRVVRHPGIDVVVEAIGGCTVARELVLEAIAHGKHVVTANKALLALHGDEVFGAARERGVMVAFEGAVAVAIPIVKALREALAGNRVEWLAGIVNGTSNFILGEMRAKGVAFEQALREAQRLGYAEADPAFDVQGIDAGHKLALLAAMAFGTPVRFEDVHVQGIVALQRADHEQAERMGHRIKLLAVARRREEGLELRVQPAWVPAQALLASVDGAMNGVLVKADAAGLTMYCGAGAGAEQTASAVIADLVDIARLAGAPAAHRVPALAFQHGSMQPLRVLPIEESISEHALRVPVDASFRALDRVLGVLSNHGVAVRRHLDACTPEDGRELVLLTREARDGDVQKAAAALQGLACVRAPVRRARVERLG